MLPSQPGRREPAINMPAPVLVAIAVLALIHLVRGFLPDETDAELLLRGGFIPLGWSLRLGITDVAAALEEARAVTDPELAAFRVALVHYLSAQGGSGPESILTHAVLHGSWLHVGLNCIWLAAFGTPVVRRAGTLRSLVLAVATAIGGALVYWASGPTSPQVMIGASGIVSGFMGAAVTFVFHRGHDEAVDAGRWPAFLRDRNALAFLAVWFVTNAFAGLLASPLGVAAGGGIAWQAHIGGLLAGLALFPLLDPLRSR